MSLIAKLQQRFFFETNHDISNTILITGSGRSGTTWLGDIVNYKNEYRQMFEPFHPRRVDLVKDFRIREYISPYAKNTPLKGNIEKVLSGQVSNLWIDGLNRSFFPSRRIIKDIRTHFMMRWIKNEYPEIPMVLLLRHPFAVVMSKMKNHWENHLYHIIYQDELFNTFNIEQRACIVGTRDEFGMHLVQWCVENYIPLTQFSKNELQLVFYEGLCTNLKGEIEGLFSFLNKEFDVSRLDFLQMHSPSAKEDSAIRQGKNPIEQWKGQLTDTQMKEGLEILRIFGLDRIYSNEFMPDVIQAWKMLDH